MMKSKAFRVIAVILLAAVAVCSVFLFAKAATSTENNAATLEALDEKKSTVLKLTAASTALSAGITALPGDTASPIAEEIADLSTYFLIIVSAIYLEKFLVPITGFAAFYLLLPAGCVAAIVGICSRNLTFKRLGMKLALFGIAISLVIPASVKVSDYIDKTYGDSIQTTLNTALMTTDEITAENTSSEETGALGKIINNIKNGAEDLSNRLSALLNSFIESVAVMIVTSCVIPILVLLFFIWLIKVILGVNISAPRGFRPHHNPEEAPAE